MACLTLIETAAQWRPPSSGALGTCHTCHTLGTPLGLTTLKIRRLRGDQIEVFKIVNGYEDVDRNMFFKLKEGSRTRGHKAALVKEQCRLDMRKYSFSQRVLNEWNKLPNDCVNASSVNKLKHLIDRYLIRADYTWIKQIVGLSISQWLPCPLAIWNLLFGMAILLNLVIAGDPQLHACNASCVIMTLHTLDKGSHKL